MNLDKYYYFIDRTQKHICLVNENIDKLIMANVEGNWFDSGILLLAGINHDGAKFREPEFEPYVELTWQNYMGKAYVTPGLIQDKAINEATLHHIRNASHHPEYWVKNKNETNVDPNNRDKSLKCVECYDMPPVALAEMVCDWKAMADEKKTNTARDWFNKQRGVRWAFSPEQEKLIDTFLTVLEN